MHGQPAPDVAGEHVVIVDFSYPKDVLFEMSKTAASILILDHHATAEKDLADFPPPCGTWEAHIQEALRYERAHGLNRIGVQFDMDRSGAMMAWNYFHTTTAPRLVRHVQDRDLWKFRLIGTREIQSWVFSYPYDFAVWDELAETLERDDGWRSAFDQGKALDRKMQKDIAELKATEAIS